MGQPFGEDRVNCICRHHSFRGLRAKQGTLKRDQAAAISDESKLASTSATNQEDYGKSSLVQETYSPADYKWQLMLIPYK